MIADLSEGLSCFNSSWCLSLRRSGTRSDAMRSWLTCCRKRASALFLRRSAVAGSTKGLLDPWLIAGPPLPLSEKAPLPGVGPPRFGPPSTWPSGPLLKGTGGAPSPCMPLGMYPTSKSTLSTWTQAESGTEGEVVQYFLSHEQGR